MRPEYSSSEQWQAVRARGKPWFVVRVGLLRFGLPMFVVMSIYILLVQPLVFGDGPRLDLFYLLKYLVVSSVMWALAGWSFAEALWRSSERRFRSAEEDG